MSLIHLAGDQVTYMGIARQRCSWCGALICERDLSNFTVQILPGMTPEMAWDAIRRPMWSGFVGRDGPSTFAVDIPEGSNEPPEGSCMKMDPEVTGMSGWPEP